MTQETSTEIIPKSEAEIKIIELKVKGIIKTTAWLSYGFATAVAAIFDPVAGIFVCAIGGGLAYYLTINW